MAELKDVVANPRKTQRKKKVSAAEDQKQAVEVVRRVNPWSFKDRTCGTKVTTFKVTSCDEIRERVRGLIKDHCDFRVAF